MTRSNPFDSDIARAHSSYARYVDGELVLLDETMQSSELAKFVHGQLRGLLSDARFSCLGAKAAINQSAYRCGMYQTMNSPESTTGLCRDLFEFVNEQLEMKSRFTTFIASFSDPTPSDEVHFEKLVWDQLQSLHNQDPFDWDPTVSSDPQNAEFSFSFAGRAFYVVGLHAGSSRWSRRFAWPTLVFNAHYQFEHLRAIGKFKRFQGVVNARDKRLQGTTNPNLTEFGKASEASQYSGRSVDNGWQCPFESHPGKMEKEQLHSHEAARAVPYVGFDRLIDISMPISPEAVLYPGDPSIVMNKLCSIGPSSPCNITQLKWTTHMLSHVDAPLHFLEGGSSLDEIPLQRFCGNTLLVEVYGDAVLPVHIPLIAQGCNLLFKTRDSTTAESRVFNRNHVYISLEAARLAIERGVNLIGIDNLSVDKFGDDAYPVHRELLSNGVLILEGLNLRSAAPGHYTLIAFPLRIAGGDGSPVRAVLIPNG